MMMPFDELVSKHNIEIKGVLHVGASTGQERFIYDKYTKGKVVWVEAIPRVYADLVFNIEEFENQIALNLCVSNVDGEQVEFNVSNNESQSSSILELAHHSTIHPEVHYTHKLKMVTSRLDTALKNINIECINFLNIDLQGAELLALQGLGEYINQFDWALLEVNKQETYKECVLIDDLDYFMLQKGFERVETGNWVADTWTDALYKKVYND
jgi:FkbM family methyltransferase